MNSTVASLMTCRCKSLHTFSTWVIGTNLTSHVKKQKQIIELAVLLVQRYIVKFTHKWTLFQMRGEKNKTLEKVIVIMMSWLKVHPSVSVIGGGYSSSMEFLLVLSWWSGKCIYRLHYTDILFWCGKKFWKNAIHDFRTKREFKHWTGIFQTFCSRILNWKI